MRIMCTHFNGLTWRLYLQGFHKTLRRVIICTPIIADNLLRLTLSTRNKLYTYARGALRRVFPTCPTRVYRSK